MRFESLSPTKSAKDDNGQPLPNIVTVSNTVYNKESTPEGQKVQPLEIKFPAELLSYPQFDAIEEFVTDCGGPERALEVINDVTAKYATTAGKTSIRTATIGTEEAIVEAGCKVSREFSWKQEQKLSTKEKANAFDILLAEKDKLTPEELMRRVMELAGK
jgi:hypothetical protein